MLNRETLGRNVDQYEGLDGGQTFTVKILRIGEKANEEVLIEFIGVDDALDGKVYRCKKEWQNSDKSLQKFIYVTNELPDGERFGLFHSNSNWGDLSTNVFLYENPEVPIAVFPRRFPSNLDPNFMYNKYIKQNKK